MVIHTPEQTAQWWELTGEQATPVAHIYAIPSTVRKHVIPVRSRRHASAAAFANIYVTPFTYILFFAGFRLRPFARFYITRHGLHHTFTTRHLLNRWLS